MSRIKEDQKDYVAADIYVTKTLDGLRQQPTQSPLGLFIELNNVVGLKIKLKQTETAKQLLAEAAGYENAPNLQIYNRATYHRLLSEVELLQGRVEPANAELKQAVALIKQDPQSTQKGTFAAEERAVIRAAVKAFLEKHAPGDKQLETLLSELQ